MSDESELWRPGYFVYRANGTIDSKVLSRPMSAEVKAEFDEIISALHTVRSVMFAAKVVSRNVAQLETFTRDAIPSVRFEALPTYNFNLAAFTYKIDASRHTLNFLSSFRAFLDHCEEYLSYEYGSASAEKSRHVIRTNNEYDTSQSYRLIYGLRNYAQHYSLPISDASLKVNMDFANGAAVFSQSLYLDRDDLLCWRGWKRVRQDLENMPQRIELMPLVHDAVSSVTNLCRGALGEKAIELMRCSDYLDKLCGILKLEPGAIPVIWVGENAGPNLPPSKMSMIPIDELKLVAQSMGAPI